MPKTANGRGRDPYATDTDLLALLRAKAPIMPEYDGCWLWTGYLTKAGYPQAVVRVRGKKFNTVHRAVAHYFHGDPPEGKTVVCHRCDVKTCVNPNHLWFGSHQDNSTDAVRKDRHARGERNGTSKLKETQVLQILELLAQGEGQTEIARRFRVVPGAIEHIAAGRSWKHLYRSHPKYVRNAEATRRAYKHMYGRHNPNGKLTEIEVQKIRALCAEGQLTGQQIADRFGVSKPLVFAIKHRRVWKDV